MDNQTDNSENTWVDRKMADLVPPGDWYPDSKRAFEQFLNRRDRQETQTSPRWIRLSMAAAILASIGLVMALLPWHTLWNPAASSKSRTSESVKAATPAPSVQSQPSAVPSTPQQEQKSAEKPGPGESPSGILGPAAKPQFSDDARRAHIQGTVAVVQQPAAPEKEEKPAEKMGPGVTPPRIIGPAPEPNYTDEARQAHIQGTVILGVIIRTDGTGKVENVVQGLGYGLDEKAIEAFEKQRFEPGTVDGKPVAVQLQVVVNFRLY